MNFKWQTYNKKSHFCGIKVMKNAIYFSTKANSLIGKESDRIEVRKYLPLIKDLLTKKDQEHKAELESIKGEIENSIAEPTELEDVRIYNIALKDTISILDSHINKLSN